MMDTEDADDRAAVRKISPTKFIPHSGVQAGLKPAAGTRLNRRALIALAALLIAVPLIGILFFLLNARTVYIQTEPPQASITIAGLLTPKLGEGYLLLPGEYAVSLAAAGYYHSMHAVNVNRDSTQTFRLQLEKLPGRLYVDTATLHGAEVLLDGASRGRTPLLIEELPAGSYIIDIRLEDYLPYRAELTVQGMGKEQRLQAELLPAWADVSFASQPENAELYIDDQLIGRTPLTTAIAQGRHSASLRLSGYKQWQQSLLVTAGEPQRFDDITLQAADATVMLRSRPAGASVTVDGNYQGRTPIEFAVTPAKAAEINLFKQGYTPVSRTFTLASGEQKTATITLTAQLVEITFSITPADAALYINGQRQAAANTTVQLPASPHRIEVKRDGYVAVSRSISPHSGLNQQLRIRLKSLQELKRESIKPVIKTFAGQTLALFKPGEFTAGASRREPGRRANEALQRIKLTREFYLGLHEVTNAQYKLFKPGHAAGRVQGNSLDQPTQPAVKLSWQDAAKYCNWLSGKDGLRAFYREDNGAISGINPTADGYRLPTEAEWAWAARAQANQSARKFPRKFPWGAKMPPTKQSGNFADASAANFLGKIIAGYNDGFPVTAPVGSFPANDKGLFDMGGNAAEWVSDFYDVSSGRDGALVDPMGPASGEFHVIRGSGWAHGTISELRLSYRDYGNAPRDDVGFRLARFAE